MMWGFGGEVGATDSVAVGWGAGEPVSLGRGVEPGTEMVAVSRGAVRLGGVGVAQAVRQIKSDRVTR